MYYVYENWPRNRGRIHKEACGYCNYGLGFHDAELSKSGKWHGPFKKRDEAFKVALT